MIDYFPGPIKEEETMKEIELNKDYAYNLSELNDDELKEIAWFFLKNRNENQCEDVDKVFEWLKNNKLNKMFVYNLCKETNDLMWAFQRFYNKPVINAKTLFESNAEVSEKPKQYSKGIDTFKRCESNMTREEILACVKFNIDKYNWREKQQDKEDLEKIISYAQWGLKHI